MKGDWKKAKKVSEEDFPKPKATKQYSKPIGPEKPVSKQTHYRKVSGVDDDKLEFPEPKATTQYKKPIGPEKPVSKQTHYRKVSDVEFPEPKATTQYSKPIGPEKVSDVEFPEPKATTQYSKPIGPEKPTPIPSKKKTISTGGLPFASVGKIFSDLQQQMGPPTWMNQSGGKRGKVSAPRAFGNVPGWVMGGRAPWDSSPESGHKDIVRTIITKVHEDGTKTRTVRGPPAPKKGSNKPNWISW